MTVGTHVVTAASDIRALEVDIIPGSDRPCCDLFQPKQAGGAVAVACLPACLPACMVWLEPSLCMTANNFMLKGAKRWNCAGGTFRAGFPAIT